MEIQNINLNLLIKGLEQIGQLEITDFHLNWNIGRNLAKFLSLWKSYSKSLNALINKHVKMDEKGSPIIINKDVQLDKAGKVFLSGGEYDYKTLEDKKSYLKSKVELDEIENDVKIFKLKTSALENLKGLNGVMLYLLGDLIEDDADILGDEPKVEDKKTT